MKDLAGAIEMIESYEGDFLYLYLDTKGKVTVGVGFLLSSADDAASYTFYLNSPPAPKPGTPAGPQKANDDQVKAEWTSMKGQDKGHTANFYQRFTTMKMLQSDVDSLLTPKLNKYEGIGKQALTNWNDFPASAQLALLDIIYNTGGLSGWPSLTKFAAAKEWANCATECNRPDVNDDRNSGTKNRFLAAAKEQPLAVDPAKKK